LYKIDYWVSYIAAGGNINTQLAHGQLSSPAVYVFAFTSTCKTNNMRKILLSLLILPLVATAQWSEKIATVDSVLTQLYEQHLIDC
jgi:4-amino-4-deoxy-L-arabinose transferase-like glycosyltransferase